VWVSTTGGGSGGWTNISGNLPDIPVRWAVFFPEDNTKAILATEMGVYETNNINGAATVWTQDPTFPIVRTDMLKYRRADGTIAAATHGRGLWTSSIPFSVPYIRFAPSSAYITWQEATVGTTGCRGYKDYTVNMSIDMPPTGAATVNLAVQGGATATQGIDYDFTTNGSFTTPSATLSFANGSTTPQPITVRVYDDADIEGTESFTLNYTVSGATNALAAPSSSSYTFYITGNDALPTPGGTATIGTGTYTLASTGTDGQPFDAKLQYKKTQMLYKASELTAMGIHAGAIQSIAFNIGTKKSTRPYQNLQIKMAVSALPYLIDGAANTVSTTTVKSMASFTPVAGWNSFTLDNPFTWDGSSSLVVEICYDNATADPTNFADGTLGYSDGGTNAQGNMFWQDNLSCSGSFNFASVNYFGNGIKPEIQLSVGNPVETVLNAAKTAFLGPNHDVCFYNANGNIIARITSQSAFNYGCTALTIDRAGTGTTTFWNNTPANYLMNKTFHVVPATNNTSGTYTITLYFTAAEKAGWEAATGNSWNNIQLVKVNGQISQVTPSTPAGAGTVSIVTPVRGTYGTGYTLSYTFADGFSGFGAGVAGVALPVTLLDFDGHLGDNAVGIHWNTSSEQNSKYFEVQKSSDGASFYPLGTKAAAGNSNTEINYYYTDRQVNEFNYYRLKMVDMDGRYTLSKTILVRNDNAGQQLWVANNPFHTYIDIRLAKTPQQPLRFDLVNMAGVVVYRREYRKANEIRLDFSGTAMSAGVYLLKARVDGRQFTHKVIKQ
jgi:hypothetical protein